MFQICDGTLSTWIRFADEIAVDLDSFAEALPKWCPGTIRTHTWQTSVTIRHFILTDLVVANSEGSGIEHAWKRLWLVRSDLRSR